MNFKWKQIQVLLFFILVVADAYSQQQVLDEDVELVETTFAIEGDIEDLLYRGELLNSIWKIEADDEFSLMVFQKKAESHEVSVGMMTWDDETQSFVVENDRQLIFILGKHLLFCKKSGDSAEILWGGEISEQRLRFGLVNAKELIKVMGKLESNDVSSLIESLKGRSAEDLFMFDSGFSCLRVSDGKSRSDENRGREEP